MPAITQIDIFVTPSRTDTFQIGIDGVTNILVKFYFANVVFIKIYYTSGAYDEYLQLPCIVHYDN